MKILVLPQHVVDRIAAGEVVQRPAAAVKELLENSLDAGATDISVQTDGIEKIIISDNGCGIGKNDLQLAAVRHATSKIQTAEDLTSIESFGFRGEALASISMVSRLSIVSRTENQQVGFKLSYIDGKPTSTTAIPTARMKGTTINVQDIFYNMPNRKRMRPSEEYNATLKVLQMYAIHYAKYGVGISCEKMAHRGGNKTDLNTCSTVSQLRKDLGTKSYDTFENEMNDIQLQVTKQVIVQVSGSQMLNQLTDFKCELIRDSTRHNVELSQSDKCISSSQNEAALNEMGSSNPLVYKCIGIISPPSQQACKNMQFILFVNNRYVDGCTSLKRSLESVYAEFSKFKPFIYISLFIPPDQVDVNVHPTKREVALLYMDEICSHISSSLKDVLLAQGRQFTQLVPSQSSSVVVVVANPYDKKRKQATIIQGGDESEETDVEQSTQQTPKNQKIAPHKLIRTNRSSQSGSLEPFLVTTQATQEEQQEVNASDDAISTPVTQTIHRADCPLYVASTTQTSDIDLTLPGAFATIASKCTCNLSPAGTIRITKNMMMSIRKPKQQLSYPCSYSSVQALRKKIISNKDITLLENIRSSYFVGVITSHRSLIQCGEELILMNHYECAREMFYQLALNRFGCGDIASLGNSIDIVTVIGKYLQAEDTISSSSLSSQTEEDTINNLVHQKVSRTNNTLAHQAATCLLEKADMLKEYFSIGIESTDNNNKQQRIMLVSLPILLDDYIPMIHGVPLFLLRLATQVDWLNEKQCFYNICQELGSFYAQVPYSSSVVENSEQHVMHIQHAIFPAVSALLIPTKEETTENKQFITVASLSQLYKIFERC